MDLMITKEVLKTQSSWYERNRSYKITYTLQRLKENNYAYEKTENQRFLRNIKRKTRFHFPLDNKSCDFCGSKATEHHHNTNPIEFDKFNYVCHNCHQRQHREEKED